MALYTRTILSVIRHRDHVVKDIGLPSVDTKSYREMLRNLDEQ